MKMTRFSHRLGLLLVALCLVLWPSAVRAEWQREGSTLAWRVGEQIVWKFSFETNFGKAFFNPVSVVGGPTMINFKPADHPWHYGMWFSWKYINHVNYWEESRVNGQAAGKTSWDPPVIDTKPDGGANVRLHVTYTNPGTGVTDLTEDRELIISAPGADGGYTIDWLAHFFVGKTEIILDRTAMPGEPGGAVNGGYAGLSIRMASEPLGLSYLSTSEVITNFVGSRSRPSVPATGFNFTEDSKPAGSLALLSAPANAGERAAWYLINQAQGNQGTFRFACAAILAPQPRTMAANSEFDLTYRIVVSKAPWTPASLAATQAAWVKTLPPAPAHTALNFPGTMPPAILK